VPIHQQRAPVVVRLHKQLNVRTLRELASAGDQLVCWRPKDSRGPWRREGLPGSLVLRLLTYPVRGYRPRRRLTNVLSAREVSAAQFWGLGVSEEGAVLTTGAYHWRWEIETS
jgi:hypothetical protein